MGQHETPLRPKGDLMIVDLSAEMTRINNVTKLVALDKAYVLCLMYSLETILVWKIQCTHDTIDNDLDNRIQFAQDTCKLIQVKVEYEEKGAQMLIQVVRSCIA